MARQLAPSAGPRASVCAYLSLRLKHLPTESRRGHRSAYDPALWCLDRPTAGAEAIAGDRRWCGQAGSSSCGTAE
jgi:hypothetical protein